MISFARFSEINGDLWLGKIDEFGGDEIENVAGDGFSIYEEIGNGENIRDIVAIGVHIFRKGPLEIDFAGKFGDLDILRGIGERLPL